MKIALAQINTTINAFAANVERMRKAATDARARGADVVVFPELALTGYPPLDLLFMGGFRAKCAAALAKLAATTSSTALIVGTPTTVPGRDGKPLHNSAAVLMNGTVASFHHKTLLPTYDVFDEARYFEPAKGPTICEIHGKRLGISICEDIWNDKDYGPEHLYHRDPVDELTRQRIDILINMSASPYDHGKPRRRLDMITGIARKHRVPIVYANLVGGNDSLVFDGNSMVIGADGVVCAHASDFAEDIIVFDTDSGVGDMHASSASDIEATYKALVMGLRDYTRKTGFAQVVIGLSGGIDSALTAALAADALGPDNVLGVSMPSPFSSQGSLDDARALAENLRIAYDVIPMTNVFDAMKRDLAHSFEGRAEDTTEENLQARIRGNLLMAISNKFKRLVLSTGNKSELAMGYCTLYGDMAGGLAVISDVPKTMVYELAHFINRNGDVISQNSITKPPSAELKPNQLDSDTLPPYDVLDPIVQLYIEERKDIAAIVAAGYDEKTVRWVVRHIERNEYKRRQAAPGLRVTHKAFGLGRRYPIAQGYSDITE